MNDPLSTPDAAWSYDTAAVQTGISRGLGETIGFPIHAAAAFQFETLEQAQDEFQHNQGLSYARIQNPTVRALEERITALEGGAATVALASGQAASLTALLSVCRAGDHVVSSASLFGGSTGMLTNILPLMGITATLVEGGPEEIGAAMQDNTRLVWAEMISNPSGAVADLAALAGVAHERGALLAIDNTCGGAGYLCRPLDHGADIVSQSLTKWAGGHGSVMGGSVTVGKRHDLSRNPIFAGGEPSLLAQRGPDALAWRQRWFGAHQLGMTLAPHSAFLIAQGLETLALRLQRESDSALALARWLEQHPRVGGVSYAGLPGHPSFPLVQKYLPRGAGAVLTFDVDDPSRFLSRLRVLRIAPNLGDVRTLVVHPWTTTHGRVPEAARLAAGVRPGTIRMSVGVEDVADLQADIEQAL
ncbi:aminotransferase class V-fold PLP-dependent enzyme [Deinococcus wulumuqiensis]|uniref:O-acetylhomoserine (Thiol)-lyase/O-acetylserine (Thiol)-lyase n=1 Tax=Deinococcus wulumuqiensis TaxID=980427 RepID=A0AAV4K203_9DEIO|nr:O-acetylhomoserine aminocarboxypropyltransferase/cysteine synthase family protein [Deinococcus wulumuqiensis]QII19380.1 O-acetylhomoserine aminocarboxypropyltransferase/cysteine synthase [Deinococcus wulumuqiensis R12]GGI77149.1 O-acetylhomoserine (thiol)-lyase/O-acetylserine (thiol)-lyase [Deinococcus wulumuqiensis]GGP30723.1 O-acetylhomoserine (thiol)-lyase/O-acetylserine (thiol)-lyase [Deinococcus wulumuqiensis]